MKKIFAILLLSSLGLGVNAQNIVWNVDPTHTTVKFAVTHLMVSEVEGNFKTYSGKVQILTMERLNLLLM